MELQQFIEAALRRSGSLTEVLDADRLDVVLPAAMAARLELPEDTRLCLRGAPAAGEQHAGFGSALLSRLCALTETSARFYRLELAPPPPKRERLGRDAASVLGFQNAAARREALEPATLEYLLVDFRYTALSEERQEGLVSVAIQADGGSSSGLALALPGFLQEHPESRRPWNGQGGAPSLTRIYERAHRRALAEVRAATRSFAGRMGRRLVRDSTRVDEYYRSLLEEAQRKKPRRGRGRPRTDSPTFMGRQGNEVLQEKLDAIAMERQRRLQDLQRRYGVTLRLEPLSVLALRIDGYLLSGHLQRRKQERQMQLGWNAVTRRFDQWMCDACGGETPAPAVCDALHLLCTECPAKCPNCSRPVCRACDARGCSCGWKPS